MDDGIKQISLAGRLDVAGTAEIDDRFVINATTEKAPVLVNMSQVDFIASIGIRMLVGPAKALTRRGGKLVVFNPTPLVRETLTGAGIDVMIPLYENFEAACADLKAAVSA